MPPRRVDQPRQPTHFEGEDVYVPETELAWIVGYSAPRLQQWRGEGLPYEKDKGYPVAQCVQWVISFWKVRAEGKKTPLDEEKLRKLQIETQLSDLELKQKHGDLLPAAEILRADVIIMSAIRDNIRAVPRSIAEQVVTAAAAGGAAEVERLLTRHYDAALRTAAATRLDLVA